MKFRLQSKIFLLDSTAISLCLSWFDWTRIRPLGGVKMYALLDYDGNRPAYVNMTDWKTAANNPKIELNCGL
ncbi:MAG: hypothetical protein CRN43_15905 [Candidatus Nephrothrix sp. EaCA]|nr:MAG: hypothetical protein CRN43_15905 [Candidatus Nephrothrix sp. EaCA]